MKALPSPKDRRTATSRVLGGRWNRIILPLLLIVILLPFAGAAFEWVASRSVASKHPPAGLLVDVGGRKNHIYCLGSGSPAVIFISGTGETYDSWAKVQPDVAKMTKACSYDRAGLGWSDPGSTPRDINRMVSELHDLLGASAVPPPYLLVGHSLGGGVIRVFASDYPQDVAGLVMVDALHPDLLSRIKLDARDEHAVTIAKWMQRVAPFGLARLLGGCTMDNQPLIHCGQFYVTFLEERQALPASAQEVGQVTSLGDKPLVVLSRDPDPSVGWGSSELRRAWEQMQEELPRLSTQGRQAIVKGATHYIQLGRPDAVTKAISDVLTTSRERDSTQSH